MIRESNLFQGFDALVCGRGASLPNSWLPSAAHAAPRGVLACCSDGWRRRPTSKHPHLVGRKNPADFGPCRAPNGRLNRFEHGARAQTNQLWPLRLDRSWTSRSRRSCLAMACWCRSPLVSSPGAFLRLGAQSRHENRETHTRGIKPTPWSPEQGWHDRAGRCVHGSANIAGPRRDHRPRCGHCTRCSNVRQRFPFIGGFEFAPD